MLFLLYWFFPPLIQSSPGPEIFVAKIIVLNEKTNIYRRYLYSFLVLFLIVIFLVNQPDLGQTLLLISTWITMIFVSGFNMVILAILGLFFLGLFFSLVSTSLIASDKLNTNSYYFFIKSNFIKSRR